jgi:uncharacterized protein
MSEADSFEWLPALLVLQGLVGAIDSFRERRRLNAVRDALYAALSLGFAWLAWQGALAWVPGALLGAQMALAVLCRSKATTPAEPILNLTLGAIAALLMPLLIGWAANPSELAPAHHGWMSWALTALAMTALMNALAALRKR